MYYAGQRCHIYRVLIHCMNGLITVLYSTVRYRTHRVQYSYSYIRIFVSGTHSLVRELTTRGIVGLRPPRARLTLGIFLMSKPNGKYRFILNGRPLSPYLTKTNFNYELLQKFLDGGVSEWQFPRKTWLSRRFLCAKSQTQSAAVLGVHLDWGRGYRKILWIPGLAPGHHYGTIYLF